MANIMSNPKTSFQSLSVAPRIYPSAYVHPTASVIGDVDIGPWVMVAPFASIRADEGTPFWIGARSNMQDGVVMHALETHGENEVKNTVEVRGKRYAIYIGERVSLAHQSQVHGPSLIEDDCFIGMKAFVFKSMIGKGSVIEPGAMVMDVIVPTGRYVKAGMVLTSQSEADRLPKIDESYPMRALNAEVVKVNTELAKEYLRATHDA